MIGAAVRKMTSIFTQETPKTPYLMPNRQWVHDAESETQYSPDVMILEDRKLWNLFVCDNMMVGRSEYQLVRDEGTFRWTSFTRDHFSFWRANLEKGSYAVPLTPSDPRDITAWTEQHHMANRFGHHAIIKGQMFEVPPSVILNIDKLKKNTVEFSRQRVRIVTPWRDVYLFGEKGVETRHRGVDIRHAWMYIGKPEFWNDQIDAGWMFQPVNIYRKQDQGYYFFNNA